MGGSAGGAGAGAGGSGCGSFSGTSCISNSSLPLERGVVDFAYELSLSLWPVESLLGWGSSGGGEGEIGGRMDMVGERQGSAQGSPRAIRRLFGVTAGSRKEYSISRDL